MAPHARRVSHRNPELMGRTERSGAIEQPPVAALVHFEV
jgi:hypothetical protein